MSDVPAGILEELESTPMDHSCRVLIVDDMPDVRMMLRAMLSTAPNVEVIGEAADGQEAMEKTVALQPDVLILDVAMPILSGLDILPPLLQLAWNPKVIMHSGFDAVTRDRAIAEGAHNFLPKGSRMDEIIDAVQDACGCT